MADKKQRRTSGGSILDPKTLRDHPDMFRHWWMWRGFSTSPEERQQMIREMLAMSRTDEERVRVLERLRQLQQWMISESGGFIDVKSDPELVAYRQLQAQLEAQLRVPAGARPGAVTTTTKAGKAKEQQQPKGQQGQQQPSLEDLVTPGSAKPAWAFGLTPAQEQRMIDEYFKLAGPMTVFDPKQGKQVTKTTMTPDEFWVMVSTRQINADLLFVPPPPLPTPRVGVEGKQLPARPAPEAGVMVMPTAGRSTTVEAMGLPALEDQPSLALLGEYQRYGVVTMPQAQVATQLNGPFVGSKAFGTMVSVAARYGVPWQLLFAYGNVATGLAANAPGGVMGLTPDLQALHGVRVPTTPGSVMGAAARLLNMYQQRYGDWALALLALRYGPTQVDALLQGKLSGPQAQEMLNFANMVADQTDKLGLMDPRMGTVSLKDSVSRLQQAAAQQVYELPNQDALREFVTQQFRALMFRDPTPGEVQNFVNMVNQQFISFQDQRRAAQMQATFGQFTGPGITFPVQGGASFLSPFGAPRDGGARSHMGVDLGAPEGTPVVAAVNGRVVMVDTVDTYRPGGSEDRQGKAIGILGDDGRYYFYAHLSAVNVANGQRVAAGQPIGAVGRTGNARNTVPHLHFEIRQGGRGGAAIDPKPLLYGGQAAAAQAGPVQQPQAITVQAPSQDVVPEAIRQTPEYKALYAGRPPGEAEETYARRFQQAGQRVLGGAMPKPEFIRAGMFAKSPAVTAGSVALAPSSMEEPTFIERLFRLMEAVEQTVGR